MKLIIRISEMKPDERIKLRRESVYVCDLEKRGGRGKEKLKLRIN